MKKTSKLKQIIAEELYYRRFKEKTFEWNSNDNTLYDKLPFHQKIHWECEADIVIAVIRKVRKRWEAEK